MRVDATPQRTPAYTVEIRHGFLMKHADILRDGQRVMSVRNVFTVRGAEQEAHEVIANLVAGKTPAQIQEDDYHVRQGW